MLKFKIADKEGADGKAFELLKRKFSLSNRTIEKLSKDKAHPSKALIDKNHIPSK